jgi:enolase
MILKAILKIKSDAKVSVTGTDIDTADIVWHDNNPTNIKKEEIKSKMQEIEYIDKRENEYPSIVDQLDDIYHNGIDGWKETIKAVKDKYPKG